MINVENSKIQNPLPFRVFCQKVIPLAFDESMSYLELLYALLHYLKETVIPAVNNNADAVEELQNLYTQLKSYVDNYFTNLDVQTEIDNKLDEMASDGTLENIINQEIFGEINTSITNLQNELDSLSINDTIFVGDSYANVDNSWADKVALKMGLIINQSYFKFAQNGFGFARTNQQFIDLLKNNESIITDKSKIKNIIVCGGLNDTNAESQSAIANAITTFCNYVNENYPNAHIYIGCIGYNSGYANANLRNLVNTMVLPAYKNCSSSKNTSYLNGVEYIMHYYGFYGEDGSHPSDVGQSYLANGIYQALFNTTELFTTSIDITSETGCHIETSIIANKLHCRLYGNITSNVPVTTSTGNITINLGKAPAQYIRNVNNSSLLHGTLLLNYGTTKDVKPCKITVDNEGNLIVNFYNTSTEQVANLGFIDCITEYNLLNF